MVSGAELPGLILAVPQTVECIVKIARTVKQWEGVDANVVFEMNRVERASEMLRIAASLIKNNPYPEDLRTQLQTRLGIAIRHCEETTHLIRSWDSRLGSSLSSPPLTRLCERPNNSCIMTAPSDCASFSSGSSAATKVDAAGECGHKLANLSGWRHKFVRMHRYCARATLRFLTCRPPVNNTEDGMPGKGATEKELAQTDVAGAMERRNGDQAAFENSDVTRSPSKFRPVKKALFLAIGGVELKESVRRMQVSIDSLNDFIHLVAILPSTEYNGNDGITFIAESKARATRDLAIEVLDESPEVKSIDGMPEMGANEGANATILSIVTKGPFEGCIVDRRPVRHLTACGRGEQSIKDTILIAKLLAEDPQKRTMDISILRCCAYVRIDAFDHFHELVFRPIPETTPRTLRYILNQTNFARHTLNDRYHFALRLATAIHTLHALGLIHGGIRPEAILVMEPPQNGSTLYTLGKPYIAGFNYSRADGSESGLRKLRDVEMAEHLYHHPRHIIGKRNQAYQTSDDVYALGVCLLEIGLWRPFFVWNEEMRVYLRDEENWGNIHLIKNFIADENGDKRLNKTIWYDRRNELIRIAQTELPIVMGTSYSDIVLYCLRFQESTPTGGESGGEYSGSLRFVNHVISELRRLDIPKKSLP